MRAERYQDGFDVKVVPCGVKTTMVPGEPRTERRLTGHRTETVVVQPAGSRTVTRRIPVPCRRVTVYPDCGPMGGPMAGTTEVMTQSQYRAAVRGR